MKLKKRESKDQKIRKTHILAAREGSLEGALGSGTSIVEEEEAEAPVEQVEVLDN